MITSYLIETEGVEPGGAVDVKPEFDAGSRQIDPLFFTPRDRHALAVSSDIDAFFPGKALEGLAGFGVQHFHFQPASILLGFAEVEYEVEALLVQHDGRGGDGARRFPVGCFDAGEPVDLECGQPHA